MSATQQASGWWDYRLQAADLPTLAAALAAIQAAGLVDSHAGPDNMLGPLVFCDSANPVNPNWPLFRYGVGIAAGTDGQGNATPAIGTPGVFYVAIRTTVPPSGAMDPTTLGLVWSDPAESLSVLGSWE